MALKFWRYDMPPIQCEGWAVVVMCSDGYFSTVSDYGNYAFWWTHHARDDFRKFILSADDDYVRRKLDPEKHYDGNTTLWIVKSAIIRLRREGEWTRDQAREEWDLLDEYDLYEAEGFSRWYEATKIPDAHECYHQSPSAQIMGFVEHTLPRLKQLIRAELDRENSIIVDGPTSP